MKRFGFGGTDSVRCLLLRYEETGSVGYDLIRTGNGTWTRSSVATHRSAAKAPWHLSERPHNELRDRNVSVIRPSSPHDKTFPIQVLQNKPRDHPPGCDFAPLWLIIPAIFAMRRHACTSLQTGLLWHGVMRLFAC